MMKKRNNFFLFILFFSVLFFLSPTLFCSQKVQASQVPFINLIKSGNTSIQVSNLPTTVTSLQIEFYANRPFQSAFIDWANAFDFQLLKQSGSKLTIYIDSLEPLTKTGSLNVGNLVLMGEQPDTVFLSGASLKMLSGLQETVIPNPGFLFTNRTPIYTPMPLPTPTPWPTPTPTPWQTPTPTPTPTSATGTPTASPEPLPSPTASADASKALTNSIIFSYGASKLHLESGQGEFTLDPKLIRDLLALKGLLEVNTGSVSHIVDLNQIKEDLNLGELKISVREDDRSYPFVSKAAGISLRYVLNGSETEIKSYKDFMLSRIDLAQEGLQSTDYRVVRILPDGRMVPALGKFESIGFKTVCSVNSLIGGTFAVLKAKDLSPEVQARLSAHWAGRELEDFAKREFISDTTPDKILTRGEFTDMMIKALGLYGDYVGDIPFTDLAGNTYQRSVMLAKNYGIVHGNPDGSFNPNGSITREEVAKIFSNVFTLADFQIKSQADLSILNLFEDRALIGDWAAADMALLVENKILLGDDQKKLNPKGNITNAQAVLMLSRILVNSNKS